MESLQAQFEAAAAAAMNLPNRPDNETMLKLYALYKQATQGDNADKKPSLTDLVGRAKWDAWNKLKGTAQNAARQQYIDLIASLRG